MTHTVPALMRLATEIARGMSRDHTEPDSPYGESLAIAIASPSVVVGDDGQHRPEDLLLGDRHVVGDVGEDGRRVEVALGQLAVREDLAAGQQPRALVETELHVALHPLDLAAVDERSEVAGEVARPARR